jgi:N-acetylneuraminic acid mutarotase
MGGASWYADGNLLYMFGGQGSTIEELNDLWTYNIDTNMWTWIGGTDSLGDNGNPGVMGNSHTLNPKKRST